MGGMGNGGDALGVLRTTPCAAALHDYALSIVYHIAIPACVHLQIYVWLPAPPLVGAYHPQTW